LLVESKAKMPYIENMNSLKVTAKGQVTLRKDILKHLGVAPGEKIIVDKLPDGLLQVKAAPSGGISSVFNLLRKKGAPKLTVEQIKQLTARNWAGKR
jgi:bifunctional DNA-binding transcriptional regulator/antitoxin component of YhaV-PrlF toxin-antitoxin module